MPLPLIPILGAAVAGWGVSQADDVIETFTGEKPTFATAGTAAAPAVPVMRTGPSMVSMIALVAAAGGAFYLAKKKGLF